MAIRYQAKLAELAIYQARIKRQEDEAKRLKRVARNKLYVDRHPSYIRMLAFYRQIYPDKRYNSLDSTELIDGAVIRLYRMKERNKISQERASSMFRVLELGETHLIEYLFI